MSAATPKYAVPRGSPVLALVLLAGCAASTPAPVSDRSLPGAAGQSAPRASVAKPEPVPAPTPAVTPSTTPVPPAAKADAGVVVKPLISADTPMYTVKPGDTLFSIAKSNGVPVRDLAAWNNLDDKSSISVGQQLRLTSPDGVTATPVKPPGATDSASSSSPPAAADGNLKTQPLAQRVPYSEQAFAQMSKAQPAPKVEPKPEVKAEPEPVAKPAPKPEAAPAAGGDNAWIWPTEGKVVGNFNESTNKGITIAGKRGQPVVASAAGRVIFSGTGLRGLGRLVVIRHPNNFLSVYAHNDKLLVKEGQNVTKGQRIAEMGNTDTDTVKLHFEIRRQGKPVDPTKLLPGT